MLQDIYLLHKPQNTLKSELKWKIILWAWKIKEQITILIWKDAFRQKRHRLPREWSNSREEASQGSEHDSASNGRQRAAGWQEQYQERAGSPEEEARFWDGTSLGACKGSQQAPPSLYCLQKAQHDWHKAPQVLPAVANSWLVLSGSPGTALFTVKWK